MEFPGLGLKFTVNEVAIPITESYSIRWYGVIIAVGFLLAVIYAWRSTKKMNIDPDRLTDAVIVGTIAGIICARLYYVAFYFDENGYNRYWDNPMDILRIHDGGIAIYGGVIGALLFGGLMAKFRGLKVPAVLDLASLGFLIGQGIGRWGNFVNQEAFGGPTRMPWGMVSSNTLKVVPNSPVHPCFFYESVLCLLGFVLLHIFTRKYRRYDGQTFILYIIWYGLARFFIEGLRTDSLTLGAGGIKISQLVAALCVAVGVALLIVFRNKNTLSGCGNRRVMESVGLLETAAQPEQAASTIFGDLPPFEEEDAVEPEPDPIPEPESAEPEKPVEPGGQEKPLAETPDVQSGQEEPEEEDEFDDPDDPYRNSLDEENDLDSEEDDF